MEPRMQNELHVEERFNGMCLPFEVTEPHQEESDLLGLSLSFSDNYSAVADQTLEIDNGYSNFLKYLYHNSNGIENKTVQQNNQVNEQVYRLLQECLTPEVEIVSVDPNCTYSSPVSIDMQDSCSDCSLSSCNSPNDDVENSINSNKSADAVYNVNIKRIDSPLHKKTYDTSFDVANISLEGLDIDNIGCIEDQINLNIEPYKIGNFINIEDNLDNFDLAAYITEEDFQTPVSASKKENSDYINVSSFNQNDNDISTNQNEFEYRRKRKRRRYISIQKSDTDENIDVEICVDNNFKNNRFKKKCMQEDNPVVDPTWSPIVKSTSNLKQKVKEKQHSLGKPLPQSLTKHNNEAKRKKKLSEKVVVSYKHPECNVTSNHLEKNETGVNNRNKKVIHKHNVGLGRGKNLSMCSKPFEEDINEKEEDEFSDNLSNSNSCEYNKNDVSKTITSPSKIHNFTELKSSSKANGHLNNLLKVNLPKNNYPEKKSTTDDVAGMKTEKNLQNEITSNGDNNNAVYMKQDKNEFKPNKIKKKLNLQEYLKRRKLNNSVQKSISNENIADVKPSNIKNNNCSANIEENKSEHIIHTTENTEPHYEEIIIVSMGSNTDISISPSSGFNRMYNNSTNIPKSTSTLFSNINDTLINANNCGENLKISSNSLIASIQDVILKKSSDNFSMSNEKINGIKKHYNKMQVDTPTNNALNEHVEVKEHGEDKIIMHLKKDRSSPKTNTIAIQTDDSLLFPLLKIPLIKKIKREKYKNVISDEVDSKHLFSRHGRSRTREYKTRHDKIYKSQSSNSTSMRSHRSRSHSSNALPSTHNNREHIYSQRSPSPHKQDNYNSKSFDSSRNGSLSRSDSDSSHSESSRSLSSSYTDSNYKYSFQRNMHPNRVKDLATDNCITEERRIVYVGRIEKHTTKEDLKAKFGGYGPIKQITLHHKDTGMIFGFVTYEKAKDAYTVIDSSACDPTINMYDISFGGRRAFCRASYLDLDGTTGSQSSFSILSPKRSQDDTFEAQLQKLKEKLCLKKSLDS